MEENSMVSQENNSPMPMGGTLAVNYVGFWSRFIAALIDAIVVGVFVFIGMILSFVLGIVIGGVSEDAGTLIFVLSYGVTTILSILYYLSLIHI